MKRHRNDDIAIGDRVGEFVAEEFRQRLLQRLVESVLMPPDQRRQRAAIALSRRAIARDRAGAGEMRTPIEAACAAVIDQRRRLHWSAADRTNRLRYFFGSRQTSHAHAALSLEAEPIAAYRASGWIEKIREVPRRIHRQIDCPMCV